MSEKSKPEDLTIRLVGVCLQVILIGSFVFYAGVTYQRIETTEEIAKKVNETALLHEGRIHSLEIKFEAMIQQQSEATEAIKELTDNLNGK